MYKILRPTLWFCKNDELSEDALSQYFSQKAIRELIQYGFIERVKYESVQEDLIKEKVRFTTLNELADKMAIVNKKERLEYLDFELSLSMSRIDELKRKL